MKPIKKFQIGKNKLTNEFIKQLANYFEKSGAEIVKVEILKSACRDKDEAKEIGDKLLEGLGDKFDYKLIGYVLTVMRFRKARR
tara:strand:- start:1540 stop:1791 length:252 start_codon:yes stop_codon:yes gene_type:complete